MATIDRQKGSPEKMKQGALPEMVKIVRLFAVLPL